MSSHPPKPPTALIILDGLGHREATEGNAVAQADMPTFKKLLSTYPHSLLAACGAAVGLPDGVMGNSQVGHLTIGAGRVTPSPLVLLTNALENNEQLKLCFEKLGNNALHLIGLVSDAGVHSHLEHLKTLIELAKKHNAEVYVHAILDGRDTPQQSAKTFLSQLSAPVASLHGRFYAMDRDKNTERTQKSFDVLQGTNFVDSSWESALEAAYARGETDEFVTPVLLNKDGAINEGDGIVMFNYRPDRSYQLAHAIGTALKPSFFFTGANYNHKHTYATPLATREPLHNTLLDVLAEHRKTVFLVAESEKTAHVTYFFSGESDRSIPTERRLLVPSIKAQSYVEHPQMRAREITGEVLSSLIEDPRDFYLINFANADMVGHSGDVAATKQACEVLDQQLKILIEHFVTERNGTVFICSDHGNAEEPGVMHTTNPVPFIAVGKGFSKELVAQVENATELQHIAPVILSSLGLCVPKEMR